MGHWTCEVTVETVVEVHHTQQTKGLGSAISSPLQRDLGREMQTMFGRFMRNFVRFYACFN